MKQKKTGYELTVVACCVAYLLQAVVVNVSPILFIPLKELYHLSYSQLGFLVLANFITQLMCDILFSGAIDKHGFRPFALIAPTIAVAGFVLFALAPMLFPGNVYLGLLLGTLLFSGSGGVLEVLLSPIVNSLPLPKEQKSATMSVVHSAYSWGQVVVVLFTTLLLFILGTDRWQWIILMWCLPALVTFLMFLRAPLASVVSEKARQSFRSIVRQKVFMLCFLSILAAGASELIISQWASSFIEKGLGVSKTIGDVAGVCTFAAAMGLGRILHAKFGAGRDTARIIQYCFLCLVLCYLTVGFIPGYVAPILAIIISGFAVSITWPAMLVETAERFPKAGAVMFAVLAAGGDTGASVGPWLSGKMMDIVSSLPVAPSLAAHFHITLEQLSLRTGMLVGALFALLGFTVLCLIRKKTSAK